MPDLTYHTARWCQENEHFSTTVRGSREYHVSYDNRQGWHCTCPAFKFGKGKSCKHIDLADKAKCDYGWEAACGSPIEMGKECPKCGGPTAIMRYAS